MPLAKTPSEAVDVVVEAVEGADVEVEGVVVAEGEGVVAGAEEEEVSALARSRVFNLSRARRSRSTRRSSRLFRIR